MVPGSHRTSYNKEGIIMPMGRIVIQVRKTMKVRLDRLQAEGYSFSGFVRRAIEPELANAGKRRDYRTPRKETR